MQRLLGLICCGMLILEGICFAGILTPGEVALIKEKQVQIEKNEAFIKKNYHSTKDTVIKEYDVHFNKIRKIKRLLELTLELDGDEFLTANQKTKVENKIQQLWSQLPKQ